MTKTEAMKKIQLILNLANDKAAAPGEKANALELAQKLADKHGLKITQAPKTKASTTTFDFNDFMRRWTSQVNHYYSFTPKYAYTKLLKAMHKMMQKAGFVCTLITEGRKVIGIQYQANLRDVNKELAHIYKLLCNNCKKFKEQARDKGFCANGTYLTDTWATIMEDACYEMDYSPETEFIQSIFKFAENIISELTNLKEGL